MPFMQSRHDEFSNDSDVFVEPIRNCAFRGKQRRALCVLCVEGERIYIYIRCRLY